MLSIKLHEPAEGVVPGTLQYIEFDFMTGGQEIKITIMKECQVIFPMLFFCHNSRYQSKLLARY